MVGKSAPILILALILNIFIVLVQSRNEKTCFGTSSQLSVGQDRLDHYHKMVLRYQNCTTVEGNLEIAGLESTDLDLSFLKDIEVVTGYVIIALNYVPSLSLENLRLIRGRELYEGEYALYISVNKNSEDPLQRLEYVNLKSLTEVSYGNIMIEKGFLCYVDSISWDDILSPQPRLGKNWNATIKNNPPDHCGKCDETCDGKCWGSGPDMCQKLTRLICSEDCKNSRCTGPSKIECCNKECSIGCTGPTDRDCLVCRHVNDSGSCQVSCPPARIYDPHSQWHVPNPDFKYHFYDRCVDKCPSNLLVEDNSCVKSCRRQYHNNGSGVCVPCTTESCEKECYGVAHHDGPLAHDSAIDSLNIHHLKGCNIINGNLIFQSFTFFGDNHTDIPPMKKSQLQALRNIKNITGYLQLSSWHKDLHDFSAFENLRFIGGVDLYGKVLSLVISAHDDYLSQVTSLGFKSLEVVAHGNVYISNLKNLCYADTVNWTSIIRDPISRHKFVHGAKVRVGKNCSVKCDTQCSTRGCWGPGPHNCLSCKNASYNGTCLSECKKELGIYTSAGSSECSACHHECKSSCVGKGPRNCTACIHFSFNGTCVGECPIDMYGDVITGECHRCSNTCVRHQDSRMCSGPNDTLGDGGCNYCEYAVTTQALKVVRCLPPGSTCPSAHFTKSKFTTFNSVNNTCVPCYEGCNNCSGYTRKDCNHPLPYTLSKATVVVAVLVPVILVICGLIIFFIICRHRNRSRQRKRLHSMRALGIDTMAEEMSTDHRTRLMEPMTPSGVAPNQAQLRIVKEIELRIGKVLGSGAFGTVHKGYWIPDLAPRERVKVPVAIKVLRDESSQVANNEILDEALVMASCEHPNLVRLLGITLAQRIMLISQLMPLGNLLDYVRENKDNIGSQHLLNWSLQIAKGMRYLAEEKHLVHRDLAARNVLVKSPNHVRITDFGLAKLLDVNEDVYRAEGGKMPIKWLALESIQQRIFTQKSDVWSFGVTMWELFTFGKRPYENVPAREVHDLLEKGERLPQPHICTIDIYMLLIRCWTVDMVARPTFEELSEELSRMAKDPPRYLVIANEGTFAELPSPTNSEFLKSLMNEDGDDFLITDAEEYLHQPAFNGATSNGNTQFPLQPVPSAVPWKRQQNESVDSTSSTQPLLGKQSGKMFARWRRGQDDNRLDSNVTIMTSLSSSHSSDPTMTNSPFPFEATLEVCEEVVLDADGRLMEGFNENPKTRDFVLDELKGERNLSDSSDVFDPPKQIDTNNRNGDRCVTPHHPMTRLLRSREDSTNLRYSAEPVSRLRQHQQLQQKAKLNDYKKKLLIVQDEAGYLCPSEAANKKPEYLDPGEDSSHQGSNESLPLMSALENPEYDPTFFPNGKQDPLCRDLMFEDSLLGPNVEYQNIAPSTEYENLDLVGGREELTNPSSPHDSSSSDESGSIKRDSGMQSGEESEKSKTAVSNPNYETLEDAQTQLLDCCNHDDTNYVNIAREEHNFNFEDEDIFNANTTLKKDGRTYSEPDSGVGIELGMDNITYHKLPYS